MKFKTPDGKEFEDRTEWKKYMMATFYTFMNKKDEPVPLVKNPGDVDGQVFEIGDCENTTMIVMDHTEQVQIDQSKNCRVFIGACASSTFIRNCTDCTFYICCQQLRLRDCINCKLYVFSLAELHIEDSTKIYTAPFLGGYPDHAKHLATAKLDPSHNLWYDVFDHNDPAKTHKNWALLPESEYEAPWFPAGECPVAVLKTAPGSVQRVEVESATMQSFDFSQLVADANNKNKAPVVAVSEISPVTTAPPQLSEIAPPLPPVSVSSVVIGDLNEIEIAGVLQSFLAYAPGGNSEWAAAALSLVIGTIKVPLVEYAGALDTDFKTVTPLTVSAQHDAAWTVIQVGNAKVLTIIFSKINNAGWKIIHIHSSS